MRATTSRRRPVRIVGRRRLTAVVAACWVLAGPAVLAAPRQRPEEPAFAPVRQVDERTSFVLAFAGDTLPHPAVIRSAAANAPAGGYDFRPMFAEVAGVLRSVDLAVCHLEVPLDPTSRTIAGFPRFSAPAEVAPALAWAGFDGCSTASNHTFDRGREGVVETIGVLEAAGLRSTGTAATPAEAGGVIYDLGGLRVGHLSYSYGFQSGSPGDRPWLANRIDPDLIIEQAAVLRERGAEFTAVSLHWGAEFASAPSAGQRALARRLLAHPAVDIIVGHHPHVLQPIDAIDGKPVIYSLGNFLSNQTAPCCPAESEESAFVLVRVDAVDGGWAVGEIRHVPTWVDRRNGHVVTPALGDDADASRRARRLALAAERAEATLGPRSQGLSVAEAYRWVLETVPNRWQTAVVGSRRASGAIRRGVTVS